MQSARSTGTEQFIVVNYEYAPDLTATKDHVVGGRAVAIGSTTMSRVGATGYDQNARRPQTAHRRCSMRRCAATPGTYVKIEGARSNGPGDGEAVSIDGGFTFNTRRESGQLAWARRIEAAADLAEIMPGAKGRIAAFWQHKDKDFSGPGEVDAAAREPRGRPPQRR